MLRLIPWHGCAILLLFCLDAVAQTRDTTGEYSSRAEEIQAERQKKAAQLTPETVSRTEGLLVQIKERRILEKLTYGIGGLRAKMGGLVTGSGFAAGPEYFRDDLADGKVQFRATTQISTRLYQLYDVALSLPSMANNRAFLTLQGTH